MLTNEMGPEGGKHLTSPLQVPSRLAEKGVAVEVTDAALYYTLDESYGRVNINFSVKFIVDMMIGNSLVYVYM